MDEVFRFAACVVGVAVCAALLVLAYGIARHD